VLSTGASASRSDENTKGGRTTTTCCATTCHGSSVAKRMHRRISPPVMNVLPTTHLDLPRPVHQEICRLYIPVHLRSSRCTNRRALAGDPCLSEMAGLAAAQRSSCFAGKRAFRARTLLRHHVDTLPFIGKAGANLTHPGHGPKGALNCSVLFRLLAA